MTASDQPTVNPAFVPEAHGGHGRVDVSVVTPSFNMLDYLQRCCASVADQELVVHEHIVMDGGSTDGTPDWLRTKPLLISRSQRDNGMYDAVNQGFRLARGEIVCHLNCDEQLLPNALHFVAEYFQGHPDVDVLFGDVLVVRPDGELIAYRKCYCPTEPIAFSAPLPVFTAAMFLRRRRIIANGFFYDPSYKDIGDVEFIIRLLRAGFRMQHVQQYLATFTVTGQNRSAHVTTIPAEVKRLTQQAPWYVSHFRPIWRFSGYGIKLLAGAYRQSSPIAYAIHTNPATAARTQFLARDPSFRWRW